MEERDSKWDCKVTSRKPGTGRKKRSISPQQHTLLGGDQNNEFQTSLLFFLAPPALNIGHEKLEPFVKIQGNKGLTPLIASGESLVAEVLPVIRLQGKGQGQVDTPHSEASSIQVAMWEAHPGKVID